ncbi:MAG: NADH-quinone oxidoreductase subunit NuoK [Deltaproteobacteria bacterium]|jgi:NADH-quinone oxidoreductase subunit K|nr:NADH-quinone oxidoreductase subunit NuoK [Deltaproteobacteria bacterium]
MQTLLLLTSALFCMGIYGLVTRRNAIALLLSAELMINAVTINLVAFARLAGGVTGQVFAVFTIALTVAEVVVGLAIVILLFRWRREIAIDSANELRH